jgi:hypothetical protein
VLALDAEFTGPYGFKCLDGNSGMPWFGVALVVDGKVDATYEGHMLWEPYFAFEPSCKAWWDTMPERLEKLKSGKQVISEAIPGLVEFIRTARRRFPGILIVVDSPTDIVWINHYLALMGLTDLANLDGYNGMPINIDTYLEGKFGFQPNECPSIAAVVRTKFGVDYVNTKPHDPVHDAMELAMIAWYGLWGIPKSAT